MPQPPLIVQGRIVGLPPIKYYPFVTVIQRYQNGSTDARGFATELYHCVFAREPDPGGLAEWTRNIEHDKIVGTNPVLTALHFIEGGMRELNDKIG